MRNLKKVIALVAVFAMMVSTVAFAQSFSDVDAEHDYFEAIEMLSNLDILTGDDQDGDGTMDFRAEDKITRAEVAVIISRIQGINNAAQVATDFVDVPATHWASGYVAQAAGKGIVNGYGDGNFGPEDNVLYEQTVKMLVETLGYAPYVQEAGGYPAGHLTAAARYGIIDGVIGASVGVEATRGQVAQMVYNAIDTPVMARTSYGADAEYNILDGKNGRAFETLLTQDLGVVKFSGYVTENFISEGNTIDTEDDVTAKVDFDESTTNINYGVVNSEGDDEIDNELLVGESNIGDYVGYYVTGYAKEAGRNEYEVIAAAPTSINDTMTISLDAFVNYASNKVEYWKNESDRATSFIDIDTAPVVYVNGVKNGTTDIFAKLANPAYDAASGQITFLNNGKKTATGYNYIFVEVNTALVVDEVTSSGKVKFKNASTKNPMFAQKIELVFDEDDTETLIELTKNGAAIDYTELKEWDVLSILANDKNNYYVVEVIDAGKVEGTVTSVASGKYTIANAQYEIALNAYEADLDAGSAGTFYIDNYGKIVAFDETGSAIASDNYAYVINAQAVPDAWDDTLYTVKVQILDKSGAIYEAYIAEKLKVENKDCDTIDKADADNYETEGDYINKKDVDADLLVAALKNKLITYESNAAGEIKTITFAQTDEDASSLYFDSSIHAAASVAFDAEDKALRINSKNFDVADDAVVFYITNSSNNVVVGTTVTNAADPALSRVDTGASLFEGTYAYVQVYDAQDDNASVVVIYNTKGGIDSASNIAFVEATGTAAVGGETVTSVVFWQDGEKKEATIDPDCDDSITAGNAYKFAMSADGAVITDSMAVGTFTAANRGTSATYDGAVSVAQDIKFGPVKEYVSRNNSIRIATAVDSVTAPYDFNTYATIKVAADTNVYVYDPARRTNKISVGDASDVDYDDEIIGQAYGIDIDKAGITDVAAGQQALGLMDFVAAFEYDGDVTDVIIFKAYDFGKMTVNDAPEA